MKFFANRVPTSRMATIRSWIRKWVLGRSVQELNSGPRVLHVSVDSLYHRGPAHLTYENLKKLYTPASSSTYLTTEETLNLDTLISAYLSLDIQGQQLSLLWRR